MKSCGVQSTKTAHRRDSGERVDSRTFVCTLNKGHAGHHYAGGTEPDPVVWHKRITKPKAKKQESADITVLGPDEVAELGREVPAGTYIMLETTSKGSIRLGKEELALLLTMLMGPVPAGILGQEYRHAWFEIFEAADEIAKGN